jgi:N-acetylneuraminate synthase
MAELTVGNRQIGDGHRCFVIAEAGVNHNGDLAMATEMVSVAAAAGADAVKFQTFVTEAIVTRTAPKAEYQRRVGGEAESQFEMLRRLEMSEEFHRRLIAECGRHGIMFLSTPYDWASVELLDRLDVCAFKIASTDTTNLPFLTDVAGTGRPMLLSTGMSSLAEVEEAVVAVRSTGHHRLALLQCTSQYPTPLDQVNLRAIAAMRERFGCPVGFSDHTTGIGAAPWAVAVGASIVEKHFTLSRSLPGPDHAMSLEPAELSALVRAIRDVEAALGDGVKRTMPCEQENKRTHQKSLVVCRPVKAGKVVTREDVTAKRPGTGLPPGSLPKVVGRRAARDLQPDDIITWSMLTPE